MQVSEHRSGTSRGLTAMLAASACFAAVFYLSGIVASAPEVVLATRMTITAACYGLVLLHPRGRSLLRSYLRSLRQSGAPVLLYLSLVGLVGFQLWLFSWAPAHGHALDASLGFLIMPLTLVIAGRYFLHDRVTRLQWVAVGIAALAVLLKLILTPSTSWVTPVIFLGYPLYFILRRRHGVDNPLAFGAESALIAPIAIGLACIPGTRQEAMTSEILPLVAVGIAGTAAMGAYLAASRWLTVPLFGLLGYLEPLMLVGVSLALGEQMLAGDLATFGVLATALTVLALEGYRSAVRTRNSRRMTPLEE